MSSIEWARFQRLPGPPDLRGRAPVRFPYRFALDSAAEPDALEGGARGENPGMTLGALPDLFNRNRPRLQGFQAAWWDGRPRVTRTFELAVDDVRIGALTALLHRVNA